VRNGSIRMTVEHGSNQILSGCFPTSKRRAAMTVEGRKRPNAVRYVARFRLHLDSAPACNARQRTVGTPAGSQRSQCPVETGWRSFAQRPSCRSMTRNGPAEPRQAITNGLASPWTDTIYV
jgi:hypothetical protein